MQKCLVSVTVICSIFLFSCDNGSGANDNNTDGNYILISSFSALKTETLKGGTRNIQIASGEYTADGILPIPYDSKITIIPPTTGTAKITVSTSVSSGFLTVSPGATLTLGKSGSTASSLIIDGNINRNPSNGIISINNENSKLILEDGASLINNRVYSAVIIEKGVFEMNGGLISGNRTMYNGGAVQVSRGGAFIMNGGTISDNTAYQSGDGGGVSVGVYSGDVGTFIMKNGIIKKNTAAGNGGGVYIGSYGSFTFEGGTIKGYNDSDGDSNKAGSSNTSGAALYNNGGTAKRINNNLFPNSVNTTIE